jgi:fucose permease
MQQWTDRAAPSDTSEVMPMLPPHQGPLTDDAVPPAPVIVVKRTLATYALYATLGCLGYLLTGLGVILPQLRTELHVSRAEVALYPSAFSLGLVIVGLTGNRLVSRFIGSGAVTASLIALATGAALLGSGLSRYVTAAGALLLGLGGAGLFYLVPLALRSRHKDSMTVVLSEGHGLSSAASTVVPLVIAATIVAAGGWRLGYLAIPLVVIAAILMTVGRRGLLNVQFADTSDASDPPGQAPAFARFFGYWLRVVLVVIAEFCMVFWATDFLKSERAMTSGASAATATLLLLGMAAGRAIAGPATRRWRPRPLLVGSAATALAGFALVWLIDNQVTTGAGLLVTGLGLALLYPITLAQAIDAVPGHQDWASARCALASGVAIFTATVGLGQLADQLGLNGAMLLMPAVLVAFLLFTSRWNPPDSDA